MENILALDLGLKRIGVALSIMGIAMPQPAIIRINRNQAAVAVKELIKKHKITKIVIGIPMGGSAEDEMRRRVEHFSKLIEFSNIVYHDESFTSREAAKIISSKKKDGKQDSIAAFLLLKDYLGI